MQRLIVFAVLSGLPLGEGSHMADFAAEGDAAHESAVPEALFASVREVAGWGDGERFAYRFRRVRFECTPQGDEPVEIWDGVTRMLLRSDQVWMDEVHYEKKAESTVLATPRRVVTHYSLTSGE